MDDSDSEIRVLLHVQRSTSVERLVLPIKSPTHSTQSRKRKRERERERQRGQTNLIQCGKAEDLHSHLVCPLDSELDLLVDPVLGEGKEVLHVMKNPSGIQ